MLSIFNLGKSRKTRGKDLRSIVVTRFWKQKTTRATESFKRRSNYGLQSRGYKSSRLDNRKVFNSCRTCTTCFHDRRYQKQIRYIFQIEIIQLPNSLNIQSDQFYPKYNSQKRIIVLLYL